MVSFNKMSAMSAIAGLAYVVIGFLEALSSWTTNGWLGYLIAGNLMMGLVLLLTGTVLLMGAREGLNGGDGEAYLVVGALLGLFAGAVALLTMGANGAEHLLGNEDLAGWTALDDFTMAIVMVIPSALLLRQGMRPFLQPTKESAE